MTWYHESPNTLNQPNPNSKGTCLSFLKNSLREPSLPCPQKQSTSNESNSVWWDGLHSVFSSNTKVFCIWVFKKSYIGVQSYTWPDYTLKVWTWFVHSAGRSCESYARIWPVHPRPPLYRQLASLALITCKGDTTLACHVPALLLTKSYIHMFSIKSNAGNMTRKCGVAFNIWCWQMEWKWRTQANTQYRDACDAASQAS